MSARRWSGAVMRHSFLLILVIMTLYPVFLMVITSVKDNTEFYKNFLWVVLPLHLSNYAVAWQQISPYLLNSVVVTGVTVIAVVIISALAAYAFARMRFAGKELLYYMVIILLMIPVVLTLVPQFVLVKRFGLLDTWWALILPYISGGLAFAIFVLRSFFGSLPDELFEAAYIDGATEVQVFWWLAMPLIRPAVGTVAILQILGTWNDYIWPSVVLLSERIFTMPIGLIVFQTKHSSSTIYDWGPLMAGYTLASLPLVVLFAFTTRMFIRGLTQGGLKL